MTQIKSESAQKKISVGMLSLGCPKTLVDSELVLGKLGEHRLAPSITDCDVAILNTCSFIQDAKQESIDKILQLIELKKEGRIKALIVLGCLVQRYPRELQKEFQEIDAFVGTGEYNRIPEIVNRIALKKKRAVSGEEPLKHRAVKQPLTAIGDPGYIYQGGQKRISLTPAHFRYVKISEGCDHVCTFCAIPSFRGKHRSRPIHDVIREVTSLAEQGAKEIILTGQDTTYYGLDLNGKLLLPELLRELNQIDKLKWIRLLYAYPSCVNENLMRAIGSLKKVCHYLDMPLQHISDPILRRMKRGITKARTMRIIRQFRELVPDLAIRTTFIVGFPGETELQFRELLQFIDEMRFERLGIFTFSQEDGTPSAQMNGQVPEAVKRKRFDSAMQLQQQVSRAHNEKWRGQEIDVMVDEPDPDDTSLYLARTYMDAPEVDGLVHLSVPKSREVQPGDIVRAVVVGALDYDLTATVVS